MFKLKALTNFKLLNSALTSQRIKYDYFIVFTYVIYFQFMPIALLQIMGVKCSLDIPNSCLNTITFQLLGIVLQVPFIE